MKSLKESTEIFLNHAEWLSKDEYVPLRNSLLMLAEDYDQDRKSSAYAQYGLTLRFAYSLRPQDVEAIEIDQLEALLQR